MGFDDADHDSKEAEEDRQDFERGAELLRLMREFIKEHEIGHEETVYQCDGPQLAAPDLIAALCKVAGFHKDGDES